MNKYLMMTSNMITKAGQRQYSQPHADPEEQLAAYQSQMTGAYKASAPAFMQARVQGVNQRKVNFIKQASYLQNNEDQSLLPSIVPKGDLP